MPLAEISMRSRSWISQTSSWWIRGCKSSSSSSPSPSPVFLKWTGQPGFPLQRMRSSWCKAYWSRMGRMHCRFGKSWSSWQMGWSWVNHDDCDHTFFLWREYERKIEVTPLHRPGFWGEGRILCEGVEGEILHWQGGGPGEIQYVINKTNTTQQGSDTGGGETNKCYAKMIDKNTKTQSDDHHELQGGDIEGCVRHRPGSWSSVVESLKWFLFFQTVVWNKLWIFSMWWKVLNNSLF